MGQNTSYQVGNEDRINVPDDVDTSHQEPREEQQLIAGKYKTQEDLEKGTLELLRQKGDLEQIYKTLESGKVNFTEENQENQENQENKPSDMKIQEEQTEDRKEIKDTLAENNLNLEEFEQEFAEKGELSPESYEKLTKMFPKSMIDSYIEGQTARAEKYQQSIYSLAGGQEQYSAIVEWASKNLSQQEIREFNDAVGTGDPTKAKFAVQALSHAYQKENAGDNILQGDRRGTSGSSGYQSRAEMTKDMSDPLYKKDSAFRKKVQDKLRNTTAF